MNKETQLTARGLERRLKRHLFGKVQTFFAITTPGFESILTTEICGLLHNATIQKTYPGGVEFCATFEDIYLANIDLRCANRILMRIDSFTARSYPELYNKAKRVQWELYCGFLKEVSFSVTSRESRLHHTTNIQKAVAEALVEYMQPLGVSISPADNTPLCFFIRFADDCCTISIDTSGDLLYKRGYRTNTAHAPVRETIAAAILQEMQWNNYTCIADPMCGSGTFLLEAAMLALRTPPGLERSFAFQKWPSFSESHFNNARKKVTEQILTTTAMKLYGSDINNKAIEAAIENSTRLKASEIITFSVEDCLEFNNTRMPDCKGLIVSNLPYGKRVDAENGTIETLIRKFGKHLKHTCKGWDFAFISAHSRFPQWSTLHITKKIDFNNGGIPVIVFMGSV